MLSGNPLIQTKRKNVKGDTSPTIDPMSTSYPTEEEHGKTSCEEQFYHTIRHRDVDSPRSQEELTKGICVLFCHIYN